MTTSKDLMLAILAMDSYNRGYGQGITGLDAVHAQIGDATFNKQSDIDPTSAEFKDGFYASAYTIGGDIPGLSGDTVISYRGTDNLTGNPFGASDIWNGWISAMAIPTDLPCLT